MARRVMLILVAGLCAAAAPAAAEKAAVFPFELSIPALDPDDLMFGRKATAEELARLSLVTDELQKLLAEAGPYEIVDLAPIKDQIETAAPLFKCNGCEGDLARKAGVDVAFMGLLEKSSDTLLHMTVAVREVATDRVVRTASVVIQGNTDESWLRAVRWLHKNRLHVEDRGSN